MLAAMLDNGRRAREILDLARKCSLELSPDAKRVLETLKDEADMCVDCKKAFERFILDYNGPFPVVLGHPFVTYDRNILVQVLAEINIGDTQREWYVDPDKTKPLELENRLRGSMV